MSLLSIQNLHATVGGNEILKGIDLEIGPGEIHAVMGPNGSGKSTLSYVLSGREGYEVTKGKIEFKGKDLLDLAADERANEGVFLAFQYPVEVPGVVGMTFLREAFNAKLRYLGEQEIDAMEFLKFVRAKLQMAVLEPDLAILDETDSGLDIDALKLVSEGVNELRSENKSMLIITHYQRLLNYIQPDHVHVLAHGKIQRSGGKELALELEAKGYAEFSGEAA